MLLALGLIMTTSNASRLTHNFRDSDNAPTIQLHSKSLQNSILIQLPNNNIQKKISQSINLA